MKQVDYRHHYWTVEAGIYSSRYSTIVPYTDPEYMSWLAVWEQAVTIPEADLADMLRPFKTQPDWLFNAPSIVRPTADTYSKDQLKAYSDDARWRKEQGGIVTTAGFPIKTDDRAQAKITGVYAAQKEVPSVVTPWRAADGSIQQLDGAGMFAMNSDLLTHINNCFAISADNYAAIDAGTMTTLAEIDAAFGAQMTQARKDWLKG